MLTAVLLLFVMTANSQNSKLEKAIMSNLDQMAKAKTAEEYQASANSFERIAI